MTFDARGSTGSTRGNNLVFGAITVTVVATAFFGVLHLPKSEPAPIAGAPAASVASVQQVRPAPARLQGKPASAYLATLGRLDPAARETLDRRLARAGADEAVDLAIAHAGEVLKAHAEELASADTRHLDAWLDMTRNSLRQAASDRNEWCAGSRYAALSGLQGASTADIAAELSGLGSALSDYAFITLNHFLLAVEDARVHPVKRGPVTPRDEAALQGVMMSMVSDPQVLPIIMAAQSGGDPDAVLKAVNVCELAATAVTAVKTLPQDTKGRVFADMVRKARFDKGDLGALNGYGF